MVVEVLQVEVDLIGINVNQNGSVHRETALHIPIQIDSSVNTQDEAALVLQRISTISVAQERNSCINI